uniref:Retrovirus-related Pol polyprotein from transposon TNT 1-94 n=1 Tax=Tanacetum cinerariifolium TaxID=118510 RepID=A0A699H474_TANCI|nr:retrovirus-related Pol polyprotein from transposon TNT 1-94 [Tanacetum cinerariifolium]
MKHTKPKTQDSLDKSVSGTATICETEPITPSVPTEVKNTEQELKINELTKLVRMTSDHEMYTASLKRNENYNAQPYQYASSSKQILKAKAKPFLPCTHYGFNDHRPDDCRNYLECGICGSYDHFTSRHNRVIHIRGGILAESSKSSESSIGVKYNTYGSTVHSTTDHNDFDHFKREPRRNDVYVLDMSSLTPNEACFFTKASESINWLWPKRPVSSMSINHEKYTIVIVDEYSRNKKDEHAITTKNKARLVAQGYSQKERINYDETFTPVVRMEAIRIFLAFATYMNFKVYQINFKSAFLNGKLKEKVYVKQPLCFESSEFPGYVCKPDKALYGLKQAPKACSSVKTLMVPPNNLGLDLAGKQVNETLYRGMIRIFKYLKGTLTLGLYYPKCSGFDPKGYSDSNYAGCNMDKKSTSGACQIVSGKLVCWSAKKQQSVALSSVEAEYVVVAACCASILWMKSQLSDYDIHYKMVPIFCDNTSAIAISNNPVLHSRTKHIDIRYHFIRDHIFKGDIELQFILIEYHLADIFTKPLGEPTITRLKAELCMLNIDLSVSLTKHV